MAVEKVSNDPKFFALWTKILSFAGFKNFDEWEEKVRKRRKNEK